MRRLIPFVIVTAVVGSIFLVAEADIDTGSCTASQAVAVDGLTSPSPICTFDLNCPGVFTVCLYTVRLDVNGTGLVRGSMSVAPPFLFNSAEWVTSQPGNPPARSAPSCRGIFSCRGGTGTVSEQSPCCISIYVTPLLRVSVGGAVVTCSGGGLAVLETITCSAKAFSSTAP